MHPTIGQQLAHLQRLTIPELKKRYAELFGEHTPANNRAWLFKRIAWRLQAVAEGGLSERARQRAAELANEADLRLSPPNPKRVPQHVEEPTIIKDGTDSSAPAQPGGRLPLPGTILT